MTLTGRQSEVYEFIRSHWGRYHRAPSMREIGDAVGLKSTNSVTKVLVALEKKGYIAREAGRARGILLLQAAPLAPTEETVPLLPVARENARTDRLRRRPARHLALDEHLLPPDLADPESACLILRVGDDGMDAEGAGIRRGDMVVVHERDYEDLDDDTLVAVFVGRTLQVRRFKLAGETIHLSAAHKRYADTEHDEGDALCTVVGEVVAVVRSYLDAA